jgi:hypothetical protein
MCVCDTISENPRYPITHFLYCATVCKTDSVLLDINTDLAMYMAEVDCANHDEARANADTSPDRDPIALVRVLCVCVLYVRVRVRMIRRMLVCVDIHPPTHPSHHTIGVGEHLISLSRVLKAKRRICIVRHTHTQLPCPRERTH